MGYVKKSEGADCQRWGPLDLAYVDRTSKIAGEPVEWEFVPGSHPGCYIDKSTRSLRVVVYDQDTAMDEQIGVSVNIEDIFSGYLAEDLCHEEDPMACLKASKSALQRMIKMTDDRIEKQLSAC